MIRVNVRIQSLKDAAAGIPIVEDLDPAKLNVTTDLTIGILEAGTVSGQTTLMILLKMPDGTTSMAEMTKNHLDMLVGAVTGAEQRFKDEKK